MRLGFAFWVSICGLFCGCGLELWSFLLLLLWMLVVGLILVVEGLCVWLVGGFRGVCWYFV